MTSGPPPPVRAASILAYASAALIIVPLTSMSGWAVWNALAAAWNCWSGCAPLARYQKLRVVAAAVVGGEEPVQATARIRPAAAGASHLTLFPNANSARPLCGRAGG